MGRLTGRVTENYPRLSSVHVGLRCACPRCGRGKLYDGLLAVRAACDACGLDFSQFDTEDGPAFFIIAGYSAIVIPLALWLDLALSPPIWVQLAVWVPVVLGGVVALLRLFKAWLLAQHFKHRVSGERRSS